MSKVRQSEAEALNTNEWVPGGSGQGHDKGKNVVMWKRTMIIDTPTSSETERTVYH